MDMTRNEHGVHRMLFCLALAGLALFAFGLSGCSRKDEPAAPSGSAALDAPTVGRLGPANGADAPVTRILRLTPELVEWEVELPGCHVDVVESSQRRWLRLGGTGYGHGGRLGRPSLPVLRQEVPVPFVAEVRIEVVRGDYTDYDLEALGPFDLYPLQPPEQKDPGLEEPFAMDSEFYQGAADDGRGFYPAAWAELEKQYVTRGERVQVVRIQPASFDPVKRVVRFLHRVRLRLHLAGSDLSLTEQMASRYGRGPGSLSGPSHRILDIMNILDMDTAVPPGPGRGLVSKMNSGPMVFQLPKGYLIIAADPFYDAVAPFAQLKQDQGYRVTVTRLSDITTTGSKVAIRNYILSLYNTLLPPRFLLLVGDTDTIPTWIGNELNSSIPNSHQPTDLYYACMGDVSHPTDPDTAPDMGYGRFPVRTEAETTAMVDKYLAYANLGGDEPWLGKAAFAATCDTDRDHHVLVEASHQQTIQERTGPQGFLGAFPAIDNRGGDELYCVSNGAVKADLAAALDNGRSLVFYSGHGFWDELADFGYDIYDLSAMTNFGSYPFFASFACDTGDFSARWGDQCFGERLVLLPDRGALAFFGSTWSTGWGEDACIQRGLGRTLLQSYPFAPFYGRTTVSDSVADGMLELDQEWGEPYTCWNRERYHVLGDPTLKVRFNRWDQIVAGPFDGAGRDDLIFYDRRQAEASSFSSDGSGRLTQMNHQEGLAGWDRLVVGQFFMGTSKEVIAYDPDASGGTFAVFGVQDGLFYPGPQQTNMGSGWEIVMSGHFGWASYDGLFLYNSIPRLGGLAKIYVADAFGTLVSKSETRAIGTEWDLAAIGQFDGIWQQDIFLYDSDGGTSCIYSTDGNARLTLLQTHTHLGAGWTHVVAGAFGGSSGADLFFYNRNNGRAQFFVSDTSGNLTALGPVLRSQGRMDLIVAGDFGGDGHTDLLYYDAQHGEGAFFTTDGTGSLTALTP